MLRFNILHNMKSFIIDVFDLRCDFQTVISLRNVF